MKSFWLCFAILFVVANTVRAKFCSGDGNCGYNQCCIKYAFVGWCSAKVNEVGKGCGGKFRCGCRDGLICVPWREKSIGNAFKIGIGQCFLDR